jgi:hypothetical protein
MLLSMPCIHARAAGEAIKVNHGLEELMLNGNSFGDDGARHLMNALKLNNTLQVGVQGLVEGSRLMVPTC